MLAGSGATAPPRGASPRPGRTHREQIKPEETPDARVAPDRLHAFDEQDVREADTVPITPGPCQPERARTTLYKEPLRAPLRSFVPFVSTPSISTPADRVARGEDAYVCPVQLPF